MGNRRDLIASEGKRLPSGEPSAAARRAAPSPASTQQFVCQVNSWRNC
jgi:hypothetical protein